MLAKKYLFAFGAVVAVTLIALFLFESPEDAPPPTKSFTPPVQRINVFVSGQVKNIAVVELEDNGNLRLVDAVNKVGGLTEFADVDAVNLAAPLTDGQHVHIPAKEILLMPQKSADDDRVNINTADVDELTTLKGVGDAMAQRIIDYREQNGKFKSVDELKNVRGIGDKKFDALRDKVTT